MIAEPVEPAIVRPLDLGGYAPELGGRAILVWVNPPQAWLDEYDSLRDAARDAWEALRAARDEGERARAAGRIADVGGKIFAWFGAIWSQGADPATHWTAEQLAQLVAGAEETDPMLWPWATRRTREMIATHSRSRRRADAAQLLAAGAAHLLQDDNLPGYIGRVNDMQAAIDRLQSKHITITQTTIYEEIRRSYREEFQAKTGSGRAAGGPVMGGEPVWVGERGPEVFLPPSMGTIVPNERLMGAAPAGPVTLVNNVYLDGRLIDRQIVEKMRRQGVR